MAWHHLQAASHYLNLCLAKFLENMASLNKFSLICDVSFDDVFIKRYRCEKTHPSITKMYGKLLMTWRIFGVMASASNNDHDDVVRPTHVMSVLVMLKTNKMFILTIPARGSKRNVTRHASTYMGVWWKPFINMVLTLIPATVEVR